ncbi:MAG: GNAT family N-acetyltransferase [bacterium]|nr:GNAT family N-acetyltransferase [bacterium]
MRLRALKQSEIEEAARIVGANYSEAFRHSTAKEMRQMFLSGAIKPYYLVAIDRGRIVGLGGFIQSWMDYSVYELFWINVRKEFQRKGVGTVIVVELLKIIKKKQGALVLLSTLKPKFYYQFGFKKLKHQKIDSGYVLMELGLK